MFYKVFCKALYTQLFFIGEIHGKIHCIEICFISLIKQSIIWSGIIDKGKIWKMAQMLMVLRIARRLSKSTVGYASDRKLDKHWQMEFNPKKSKLMHSGTKMYWSMLRKLIRILPGLEDLIMGRDWIDYVCFPCSKGGEGVT